MEKMEMLFNVKNKNYKKNFGEFQKEVKNLTKTEQQNDFDDFNICE